MFKRVNFKIIILLLLAVSLFSLDIEDVWAKDKNIVNIYFFHSNGCSHCKSEKKILEKLGKEYNNIKIYSYEIHDTDNEVLLEGVSKIYKVSISGVPVTIIGDKLYSGFSDEDGYQEFKKIIDYYSNYGYEDKVYDYLGVELGNHYNVSNDMTFKEYEDKYFNYKLIGKIGTDDIDKTYLGIVIGVLEGLNPIMLLGLVIISLYFRKNSKKCFLNSLLYIGSAILFRSIMEVKIFCLIIIGVIIGFNMLFRKKDKWQVGKILLVSSIGSGISSLILPKYLDIFNKVLSNNGIGELGRIIYYLELYFIWIFILVFIFMILKMIIERVNKKIVH